MLMHKFIMKTQTTKPIMESMINTSAIAVTSYGVLQVTAFGNPYGLLYIAVGIGLETYKYWGRNKKYW